MEQLSRLTPAEYQKLLDAPALVALLIGAADSHFDREEKKWTAKLVYAKTFSPTKPLHAFWQQVKKDFSHKLTQLASQLPGNASERNQLISKELEQLNVILAKLDAHSAWYFYKDLRQLAEETARASGGFLRIGAVSAAEHRWIRLPMLTEIKMPPDLPAAADDDDD